jgi:hypothetical protein
MAPLAMARQVLEALVALERLNAVRCCKWLAVASMCLEHTTLQGVAAGLPQVVRRLSAATAAAVAEVWLALQALAVVAVAVAVLHPRLLAALAL